MSSQRRVLCSRPPAMKEKPAIFYGITEACLCCPHQLFKHWPLNLMNGLTPETPHFTAVNTSLRFRLESYGIRVTTGCGVSVHQTKTRAQQIEWWMFLCYAFSYLSCCFLLSLSNIHSSIFIRRGANWIWDCFDATRLAFFRNFKVMLLGFVTATGGWVGLRSHYNASHRGTVGLRKQPSWRSERNSLVCASEKKGAGRGIFLLLRKWCSAPVVRGQKKMHKCTAASPHLFLQFEDSWHIWRL